jgi:hypothetical protein
VKASQKPGDKQPFPIFASRDEVEAYSDKVGDAYYEICYWLEGRLNLCVMAMHDAYVELEPDKRRMQKGVVRQMICREDFRPATLQAILKSCPIYAKEETCHAYTVREALTALELELHLRSLLFDLANPEPKQTNLVLGWLCDWLESRMHYLAHRAWYVCPESFSPDADISHLSNLGYVERHLANMPARDQERFHGLLDRGAKKYDGTKLWPQVGKVMHDPQPRTWTHPAVDARIIGLWPLVVRYNWTYSDLLKVLDRLLPAPLDNQDRKYPLDSEASLKVHCRSICGLTKSKRGKSAVKIPEGWIIAEKLFTGMGK